MLTSLLPRTLVIRICLKWTSAWTSDSVRKLEYDDAACQPSVSTNKPDLIYALLSSIYLEDHLAARLTA